MLIKKFDKNVLKLYEDLRYEFNNFENDIEIKIIKLKKLKELLNDLKKYFEN